MLTISRKKLEAVRIGDVVVRVKRIQGSRVYISIDAPRETKILRAELAEIQTAYELAASRKEGVAI